MNITLSELKSSDPSDIATLQSVLEDAPKYWLITSGLPAPKSAALQTFTELPPGKVHEDKFVLSLEHGGEKIGCCDLVRGYPNPSTAMLGLLLLRETHQKKGLGRASYTAIENRIREWPEARTVRIGVVATNLDALRFWNALGFVETGTKRPHQEGTVTSEVLVFEKTLPIT